MFRPLKRPFGYNPAARKTAPSRPRSWAPSSPSSSENKSDRSIQEQDEQDEQEDPASEDCIEQGRDSLSPKPHAKRARRNTDATYRSVVRDEPTKTTYNTRSKSKESRLIPSSTGALSNVRQTGASLSGDDSSTSYSTSTSEDVDIEDDDELATSFAGAHGKREKKERSDRELRKDMVKAKRVLERNGKMKDMPKILRDIFDSL